MPKAKSAVKQRRSRSRSSMITKPQLAFNLPSDSEPNMLTVFILTELLQLEVDSILWHRKKNGRIQYLHDSLEPYSHIIGCYELLYLYVKKAREMARTVICSIY